ncbi:hypothetical protein MKW98_002515, partial [Papaver atlanticum]
MLSLRVTCEVSIRENESFSKLLMLHLLIRGISYNWVEGLGLLGIHAGDHEYTDVVIHCNTGVSERSIVDIDFLNHLEITIAV